MSVQEHVDSLRNKHAHLEHLIDEELHRPMPDQASLVRMKKEKLRIKEEIERLRHVPDAEERGRRPTPRPSDDGAGSGPRSSSRRLDSSRAGRARAGCACSAPAPNFQGGICVQCSTRLASMPSARVANRDDVAAMVGEALARLAAVLDRREHRAAEQHEAVGIGVVRGRSRGRPRSSMSRLISRIELVASSAKAVLARRRSARSRPRASRRARSRRRPGGRTGRGCRTRCCPWPCRAAARCGPRHRAD